MRKSDRLRLELEDESQTKLSINKSFAAKYEEQKQKEELTNGRKYFLNDDEDDDDGEEEDDDGMMITPTLEKTFLELLPKLSHRSKDIYEKKTNYFPDYDTTVSNAKEQASKEGKKKEKKVTMKDLKRQEILSKMDGENGDEDYESDENEAESLTPAEELKRLKESFFKKAKSGFAEGSDEDSDDDLLVLRNKDEKQKEREEEEFSKWQKSELQNQKLNVSTKKGRQVETGNLLEHFWSAEDTEDPQEKFLRRYILNEGWIDKDKDRVPSYDEIIREDEADEEDLDAQDLFEKKYNFRFEEPESDQIATFPRTIEDSGRRTESKRKKARAQAKEKKLKEKKQKEEQKKRLKNLQKKEIHKKMEQIKHLTKNKKLSEKEEELANLIDEDYDPEEFDKKMETFFDEDYYNDDDDAKPEFSDDDDVAYNEDQFVPAAEKSKVFAKAHADVAAVEKKDLSQAIDKYYNLDYEDMIGDTPVRFAYQKVTPNNFGLEIADILEAEEKALNAYVPLKHLAPYRAGEARPKGVWSKELHKPVGVGYLGKKRSGSSTAPPSKKHKRE